MEELNRYELLKQFGEHIYPVVINVGTYSGSMMGYVFPLDVGKDITQDEEEEILYPIYAMKTHIGPIHTVHSSGVLSYSAGQDERVQIYNIQKNQLSGDIRTQNGDINKVTSFGDNNNLLILAQETIIVMSKILEGKEYFPALYLEKAHKGEVSDVAVHPSHRLFLSAGVDGRLKMWNLLNGECEFQTHLKTRAEHVRWSPRGICFALSQFKNVDIYDTKSAMLSLTLKHDQTVTAMEFLLDFLLCVGLSNGDILIYDLDTKELLHKWEGIHSKRIKDLSITEINPMEFLVISTSSDGRLAVFRMTQDHAQIQCTLDTEMRCQSLDVNFLKSVQKHVKKGYKEIEEYLKETEKAKFAVPSKPKSSVSNPNKESPAEKKPNPKSPAKKKPNAKSPAKKNESSKHHEKKSNLSTTPRKRKRDQSSSGKKRKKTQK